MTEGSWRKQSSSELFKGSWHPRIPLRIINFVFLHPRYSSTVPAAPGWSESLNTFQLYNSISEFFLMPKVNSYAPAWLCRPSPGAKFLSSSSAQIPAEDLQTGRKAVGSGATRTIAKRGNEVFAVVDNEIRWSNLARLKDQWQQETKQKKGSASQTEEQADCTQLSPYRV